MLIYIDMTPKQEDVSSMFIDLYTNGHRDVIVDNLDVEMQFKIFELGVSYLAVIAVHYDWSTWKLGKYEIVLPIKTH